MSDTIASLLWERIWKPSGKERYRERAASVRLPRFPIDEQFPVQIAGEVEDIDDSVFPFLAPRQMAHWTSPVFRHAMIVAHRAVAGSRIEITPDLAPRVAITFSSAVGGQDAVINADRRMKAEGKLPHPFTNPNSCINMVGGKISILTKATGPITSTITACATGLTSVIIGSMLLEQGKADVAICGAVDFALVEPIVAGFATMNGAFNPKPGLPPEPPERASRPFSADRRGFVISEGAGCIVIATAEFAETHGIPFSVALAGWSMTSDAHHFVAPNFDTVQRCIRESIDSAGIEPGQIDAVNAHGTSTRVGDQVEYDALTAVFGRTFRRSRRTSPRPAMPWGHPVPLNRFWPSKAWIRTYYCRPSTIRRIQKSRSTAWPRAHAAVHRNLY